MASPQIQLNIMSTNVRWQHSYNTSTLEYDSSLLRLSNALLVPQTASNADCNSPAETEHGHEKAKDDLNDVSSRWWCSVWPEKNSKWNSHKHGNELTYDEIYLKQHHRTMITNKVPRMLLYS